MHMQFAKDPKTAKKANSTTIKKLKTPLQAFGIYGCIFNNKKRLLAECKDYKQAGLERLGYDVYTGSGRSEVLVDVYDSKTEAEYLDRVKVLAVEHDMRGFIIGDMAVHETFRNYPMKE